MGRKSISILRRRPFGLPLYCAGRRVSVKEKPRIIGVAGTGGKTGVTHFSIMAAGYLNGVRGYRCAVLEWNDSGTFELLMKNCLDTKKGASLSCFTILSVDYYGNAGPETLLLCKKRQYHDVIVDYGAINGKNWGEFLRCDRQFLVGSMTEWQTGAFLEAAGRWKKADVSWETLVVFGSEETRKNMEKALKLPIRRIPVSVDAFLVTGEVIEFYQQIL